MKKPTKNSKMWLRIHARNAIRRRLRTRGKLYQVGRFVRGETRIRAPEALCLATNYAEVIDLIDKIQKFMLDGRPFVDFKPIKSVSLDAALLLTAMLDMWQRMKKVTLRTRDVEKWLPEVAHTFRSLGLFDLLRTPGQRAGQGTPTSDLQVLKLCSGQGSDGSLAHQLTLSLRALAGDIDNDALYVGLTEAMTNAGQHAYPADLYQGIPDAFRRWWMTGSYNLADKSLRILILDIGVGIPLTLPRSTKWEQAKGYLARYLSPDDADRIEAAVHIGRTSTGIQGRGHGLDDIRKFTDQHEKGRLRILSGRGEVVYRANDVHPTKITHPISIPGTLIEWEIFM